MSPAEFLSDDKKHVTVRIVDEENFNRLVNVIPRQKEDGSTASFVGVEQDLAGVEPKMTVKFPDKKRGVVKSVSSAGGMTTVALQVVSPPL